MDRIPTLLALLEKNPTDDFLQHALALEYIKINKARDAVELFEKLLLRNPEYVGSYYHIAKLLVSLNRTQEAEGWYEKGLQAAKKAGDNHAFNELRAAYDELLEDM